MFTYYGYKKFYPTPPRRPTTRRDWTVVGSRVVVICRRTFPCLILALPGPNSTTVLMTVFRAWLVKMSCLYELTIPHRGDDPSWTYYVRGGWSCTNSLFPSSSLGVSKIRSEATLHQNAQVNSKKRKSLHHYRHHHHHHHHHQMPCLTVSVIMDLHLSPFRMNASATVVISLAVKLSCNFIPFCLPQLLFPLFCQLLLNVP